jgi:pyrroloquinoline quinone biosynthesis protein B
MCLLYWQGDRRVARRTQSSLAVSGDGTNWIILNCSPDIREQIAASPHLQPKESLRGSPIRAVVLTSGDIDHLGGLLSLREQTPFRLYAAPAVLNVIAGNSVFDVLDPAVVSAHSLCAGHEVDIPGGLRLRVFPVPGKEPLYMERDATQANMRSDFTLGLRLSDANGKSIAYVPACAAVDDKVRDAIGSPDALFFDGTVWTDDELIAAGVGQKTGRRMGHLPISGLDGSIAALADVPCGAKFFVHINNTNPLNFEASPERRIAEDSGWGIPHDGMEIAL